MKNSGLLGSVYNINWKRPMTMQIFYLDLIDDSLKHWMIHIAIMTPKYLDTLPLAIPPVISLMTQPCFSDIYSKDFVEQSSGWRRMDSHNLKLWEYNFLFNFRRKRPWFTYFKIETMSRYWTHVQSSCWSWTTKPIFSFDHIQNKRWNKFSTKGNFFMMN